MFILSYSLITSARKNKVKRTKIFEFEEQELKSENNLFFHKTQLIISYQQTGASVDKFI